MTETHEIRLAPSPDELESLLDEIRLYLEAIDVFRSEGHEPRWRHEAPRAEKEALR
jgi:hypothetical protein